MTLTRDELRGYIETKCAEARAEAREYRICEGLLTERTLELRRTETKRDECFGALEVFQDCDEHRLRLVGENASLEEELASASFWSWIASASAFTGGAILAGSAVCFADSECSREVSFVGFGAALLGLGASVAINLLK